MYSKLLVPLDGSATARLALEHAAMLAHLSGATVVLLHIIDGMDHSNGFERPQVYIREVRPGFLTTGQAMLDEAANQLRLKEIPVETVLLETNGEPVSELIARQAEATGSRLVIMGTHGRRGMNRLMLGSDAEQVARISPVPVMLVRQAHATAPQTPTAEAGTDAATRG